MKAVSIVISLLLFGLAARINALPIFEIRKNDIYALQALSGVNIYLSFLFSFLANDFDRYGKQCPLKSQTNLACPTLCVTNHNLCPPALAPTCPTGQQFCGDGTCQTTCEGIDNMCSCGDLTLPTNYVPCATGQQVNITHFDPRNAENQTQQACAAAVNVTLSGSYPVYDQPSVWVTCPTVVPYFTWHEPMWIAIWTYVALQAFILVAWHLYKTTREYPFKRELAAASLSSASSSASSSSLENVNEKANISEKGSINKKANTNDPTVADEKMGSKSKLVNKTTSDASSEATSLRDSERLRFRGFKNDYFGLFTLGSVVITTVLFIVFLACIVSDNCKSNIPCLGLKKKTKKNDTVLILLLLLS